MSNGGLSTLSIGGILVRGVQVLRRNLVPFGTLSVVFMLPPFVLGLMFGSDTGHRTIDDQMQFQLASPSVGMVAVVLLWILLYFLLFATLTHGTISDLRGTPARIGASLSWSLGRLSTVIGITIVAAVGVSLAIAITVVTGLAIIAAFGIGTGFFGTMVIAAILAVPGVMLMTRWWVAVAAAVIERTGIFASLGRSARLTHGHRWRVFGIIAVIYAGQFIIDLLITGMLGRAPYFTMVASFLVTVAITAYFAVVTAVCYHDLRVLKDGVGVDQFAQVFD